MVLARNKINISVLLCHCYGILFPDKAARLYFFENSKCIYLIMCVC